MESEHYLEIDVPEVADYGAGNDEEGDGVWEDPFGYSLLAGDDGGDDVGYDASGTCEIEPTFVVDVYVMVGYLDLGPTADSESAADPTPVITLINPVSATPSPTAPTPVAVVISGSGFGAQGSASAITISPGDVQVTSISYWSSSQINATFTLPANAATGQRAVTITSGGTTGAFFFAPQGQGPTNGPTSGPAYFGVAVAPYNVSLAPCSSNTDPLNANQLNVSTGDTTDCVMTTVTPSTTFTPNFSQFAGSHNAASNCWPTLSFSSGSGQGSVSSTVTASPAGCGDVFSGYALAEPSGNSSNSIQVVVPPQLLVEMLYGEAYGQGQIGDNVSELAIGVTVRNRFSQTGFGGVTTYQAAITGTQFKSIAKCQSQNTCVLSGHLPELNNASEVFAGTTSVTVASAGCFFSPTPNDWTSIMGQLTQRNTGLTPASQDPGCYAVPNSSYGPQYLVKQSIGVSTTYGGGVPAFVFVQAKPSATAAAVISIP